MESLLLYLNDPTVLLTLFSAAILLVLIDYMFPVDWPAYIGYALFAIFIGATVPVSVAFSYLSMAAVFSLMLTLHKAVFSKFLTNAPRHERSRFAQVQNTNSSQLEIATQPPVEETKIEGDNDVIR